MGIFTDINNRLGNSNYLATREVTERWEWVEYYAGLREGREEYVRNEAIKRGMGGTSRDTYVAQPVPFALSQASSNLLFSETPTIKAGNEEDQARLDQIIKVNKLYSQCRAAAITSSSEGGVYLKLSIDPSTSRGKRAPLLQFISELKVAPTFKAQELVSASVISSWEENRTVYRLLEEHEPGIIYYKLFRGTRTDLGTEIPLTSQEATADIDPETETGIDELLITYIPNALTLNSPFGRSDYANGIDTLFYQFNDATSIAHRATQSGVPLTFMPRELLDENQNLNHEKTIVAVNKLADTLGEGDIGKMIETVQHDAQQGKFMEYAKEVLDLLLIFSGISPQSMGRSVDGGASSGTALKLKMSASLATAASKAAYYEDGLGEMLRLAAILDTQTVGDKPGVQWTEPDAEVSVKLSDGLPDDETEAAAIIQTLRNAGAMSLREAVRRANPEATEQQIEEEVAAIRADTQQDTEAIAGVLPTFTPEDLVGNLGEAAEAAAQAIGGTTGAGPLTS